MAFMSAVVGVEKSSVRVDPRQADGTFRPVILELGDDLDGTASVGADGMVRIALSVSAGGSPSMTSVRIGESPFPAMGLIRFGVEPGTPAVLASAIDQNDNETALITYDPDVPELIMGHVEALAPDDETSVTLNGVAFVQLRVDSVTRFRADATGIGFFGVSTVARAAAYTQTYSTAARTIPAYVSDTESIAYTGIDNAQGGTPYAQLTDLNALRVAYENLRVQFEALQKVVNALIDDAQGYGLAQ